MNPKKKMEILRGSLESGIIAKEEFDKSKENLQPGLEEFDKRVEEINKEEPEAQKSSEKSLIIAVSIIVLLLASIFAFSIFYKQQPKTLEDLHLLNLQGKLKKSQGYVYKGVYSFVTLDGLWYTQLTSPKGTKEYSLALRYSPRELTDITVGGALDIKFFDAQHEFYVTFNPTGKEFSFVALAAADFNTHMSKVFEKTPIAACDRNETEPCRARPIVTCEDRDKLVLYVKESERPRAYYDNNCIVVEGKGLELVRGVDRILYSLYGIMEQEEI